MTRAAIAYVAAAIGAVVAVWWLTTSGEVWSTAVDAVPGTALAILAIAAAVTPGYRPVAIPASVATVLWFAGLSAPLQWVHQGALAWLVLAYPAARLRSGWRVAVVVFAAVAGTAAALLPQAALLAASALAVCTAAALRLRGVPRAARPAATTALAAAIVLTVTWIAPLALRTGDASRDVALAVYLVGTTSVAVLLLIDVTLVRSSASALADVVIDLRGVTDAGSLRDRLARVIGDPDLWLGYRLADGRYVDEAGLEVRWHEPTRSRVITPIDDDGRRLAVLLHDRAVHVDPALLPQIAAALSLALRNVQLHADVRARVAEVEDSRDRLLEAEDAALRGFAAALEAGPARRLTHVADLLAGIDDTALLAVQRAQAVLTRFARGLHPAAFADDDLVASLRTLAEGLPADVRVHADVARLDPDVRAAVWYICAEALTNAAKHADPSRVTVSVDSDSDGTVRVTVEDDGRGGASMDAGTGLRGIRDRAEALGGALEVESPTGGGTIIQARVPAALPVEVGAS
ncbi:ATP-binding protein [Microbacterium sp. AZCO]|uniref:ATP-binding protein n=1 Tax=Microbacterium sp. AZCO TaxID=3142976 RepID=UPI0031F41C38